MRPDTTSSAPVDNLGKDAHLPDASANPASPNHPPPVAIGSDHHACSSSAADAANVVGEVALTHTLDGPPSSPWHCHAYLSCPGTICRTYVGWSSIDDDRRTLTLCRDGWCFLRPHTFRMLESNWLSCSQYVANGPLALKLPLSGVVLWQVLQWLHPFDQQLGLVDASLWRSWTLYRTALGDWCEFYVPMRDARRRPRLTPQPVHPSPAPTGDTAWFPHPPDPWDDDPYPGGDGLASYHAMVPPEMHANYPNTARLSELVERACPCKGPLEPALANSKCFFKAVRDATGWANGRTTTFLGCYGLSPVDGVSVADAYRALCWRDVANLGFLTYEHHQPTEAELRDLPTGTLTDRRWSMWCLGPSVYELPWVIFVPCVDFEAAPGGRTRWREGGAHWVAAPRGVYVTGGCARVVDPLPSPLPPWYPHRVGLLPLFPHRDPESLARTIPSVVHWCQSLGKHPAVLDAVSGAPAHPLPAAPSLPPAPPTSIPSAPASPPPTITPSLTRVTPAPTPAAVLVNAVPLAFSASLAHAIQRLLAQEAGVRAELDGERAFSFAAMRMHSDWVGAGLPGLPPLDAGYHTGDVRYLALLHRLELHTRNMGKEARRITVVRDADETAELLSALEQEAWDELVEAEVVARRVAVERERVRLARLTALRADVPVLLEAADDARLGILAEQAMDHDLIALAFTRLSAQLHLRDIHAAIPAHTFGPMARATLDSTARLHPYHPNTIFIGAIPPHIVPGAHWACDPRQQITTRDLINAYRLAGMTVCDHGAWTLWCPCIWLRVVRRGWPREIRTTMEATPRLCDYQQLVARDGWTDVMVSTDKCDMGGKGGVQLGFRDAKFNMVATHSGPPPQASNAHTVSPGLLHANDPLAATSAWTVVPLDVPAATRRLRRHIGYHALSFALLVFFLLMLLAGVSRCSTVVHASLSHLDAGAGPFAPLIDWAHWIAATAHTVVVGLRAVAMCTLSPTCHHIDLPPTPSHPTFPGPSTALSILLHLLLLALGAINFLLRSFLAADIAIAGAWLLHLGAQILLFRRMPGLRWVPYQPRALLQRALKLFATPEQARVLLTTSIAMGDEVNAVKTVLTSARSIGHANKFEHMSLTDHLNSANCIVVCLRTMCFGPSPGYATGRLRRKVIQNVTPHATSPGRRDCPWCGAHRPQTPYRWHMGECPDCWAVANDKRPSSTQAEAWRTVGLDEGGHTGIAPLRSLELPPPKIKLGDCVLKVEAHAPLGRPREDLGICGWGLGFLLPRARPYVTEKSYVGLIKGVLCRLAKARKHHPEAGAWTRPAAFHDLFFHPGWDACKHEPYSQEEWRRGFHPRRIKAFNQAWDTYVWLGETWCARYEKFTIFLKREWLADGADGMPIQVGKPRIIQSPHDITHVLAGPALKKLTHLLKAWWHVAHPIFYASVTPKKLDVWLNSLPEDSVYLWCDYKMFDATHSRESWEFVRAWYETLLPESYIANHHWQAVMDAWQDPRGKAWAKTGEKVRYAAQGINASGRDDTALANALLNGVAMMIALTAVDNGVHSRDVTREQLAAAMSTFRLAVVGDDSLAALPAQRRCGLPWLNAGPAVADAIASFGFEAEVGVSAHRADAVFLGQRPYRYASGWHWGPTLGRRLYKHHCLLAPAVHRSAWLLGVADMELRAFNHIPIMRQMAATVCRLLHGRKRTKWSMFRDGHTNHDPEYVVDWALRELTVEPDDLTYEELVGVYARAGHAVQRADFHDLERQAEEAVRLPHVVHGELASALAMTDL